MSDHEGDGVALFCTDHPVDEAAEEALTRRVSAVIRAEAKASGEYYWSDLPLYNIAAAAIAEVRKADNEFHEEMEARLEAATETVEVNIEVDRWQDIATAPEGEPILVYVPGINRGHDSCEVVIIYNGDQYWTNGGPNAGDAIEWEEDWRAGKPTHWQPLPSPPKPKLG